MQRKKEEGSLEEQMVNHQPALNDAIRLNAVGQTNRAQTALNRLQRHLVKFLGPKPATKPAVSKPVSAVQRRHGAFHSSNLYLHYI
jgi:hypothetical protein